ncbi:MAG: hypothetical protein WAO35_23630 [Terriglobia bacterium]
MGPFTQVACGAECPAYNRGCYGCFGPMKSPDADALTGQFWKDGMPRAGLVCKWRGYADFAEAFG